MIFSNIKTFLVFSVFTIQSLILSPETFAAVDKNYGTAAFLLLVDQSGSMAHHEPKLARVAAIIESVLERSYCSIKVGVGNMQYESHMEYAQLRPWGEPAFLKAGAENFSETIADRITNPQSEQVKARDLFIDSEEDENKILQMFPDVSRGDEELTYSSLVGSIEANLDELAGANVVGTLMLTDAAPAFETFTPEDAIRSIESMLGRTLFASAIIGPDLTTGMMYQGQAMYPQMESPTDTSFDVFRCSPDLPGSQISGNQINTNGWKTKNIQAINEFTKARWENRQWDVCKEDYDKELMEFVMKVLMMGDCIPSV